MYYPKALHLPMVKWLESYVTICSNWLLKITSISRRNNYSFLKYCTILLNNYLNFHTLFSCYLVGLICYFVVLLTWIDTPIMLIIPSLSDVILSKNRGSKLPNICTTLIVLFY